VNPSGNRKGRHGNPPPKVGAPEIYPDRRSCVACACAGFVRYPLLGSHTIDAKAYLIPITIESGPASGSTRVAEKPASFIQPAQSAPV